MKLGTNYINIILFQKFDGSNLIFDDSAILAKFKMATIKNSKASFPHRHISGTDSHRESQSCGVINSINFRGYLVVFQM